MSGPELATKPVSGQTIWVQDGNPVRPPIASLLDSTALDRTISTFADKGWDTTPLVELREWVNTNGNPEVSRVMGGFETKQRTEYLRVVGATVKHYCKPANSSRTPKRPERPSILVLLDKAMASFRTKGWDAAYIQRLQALKTWVQTHGNKEINKTMRGLSGDQRTEYLRVVDVVVAKKCARSLYYLPIILPGQIELTAGISSIIDLKGQHIPTDAVITIYQGGTKIADIPASDTKVTADHKNLKFTWTPSATRANGEYDVEIVSKSQPNVKTLAEKALKINNSTAGKIAGLVITPSEIRPGTEVTFKITGKGLDQVDRVVPNPLAIIPGLEIDAEESTATELVLRPAKVNKDAKIGDSLTITLYNKAGNEIGKVTVTVGKKGFIEKMSKAGIIELGTPAVGESRDRVLADVRPAYLNPFLAGRLSLGREVYGTDENPTDIKKGYVRLDGNFDFFVALPEDGPEIKPGGMNIDLFTTFGRYTNTEAKPFGTDRTKLSMRHSVEGKVGIAGGYQKMDIGHRYFHSGGYVQGLVGGAWNMEKDTYRLRLAVDGKLGALFYDKAVLFGQEFTGAKHEVQLGFNAQMRFSQWSDNNPDFSFGAKTGWGMTEIGQAGPGNTSAYPINRFGLSLNYELKWPLKNHEIFHGSQYDFTHSFNNRDTEHLIDQHKFTTQVGYELKPAFRLALGLNVDSGLSPFNGGNLLQGTALLGFGRNLVRREGFWKKLTRGLYLKGKLGTMNYDFNDPTSDFASLIERNAIKGEAIVGYDFYRGIFGAPQKQYRNFWGSVENNNRAIVVPETPPPPPPPQKAEKKEETKPTFERKKYVLGKCKEVIPTMANNCLKKCDVPTSNTIPNSNICIKSFVKSATPDMDEAS